MTTVLVAGVTAVARAGLVALLAARKTLRVVTSVPGVPLAQQLEDVQPDVLLLDLPNDGLGRPMRELARNPRPPVIVILTDDPHDALTTDALRSGVRAVLPREATAGEIIGAIEAAAVGLVVLHPAAVPRLRLVPSSGSRREPGGADQPLRNAAAHAQEHGLTPTPELLTRLRSFIEDEDEGEEVAL